MFGDPTKAVYLGLTAWFLFTAGAHAETISDSVLGYSINLPGVWKQYPVKPGIKHVFKDSTGRNKSLISVQKFPIDKSVDPTPSDWVRSQFIAYKLYVDHSVYPFGAVLYYDSLATTTLGGLWSPEIYVEYYFHDDNPAQAEYLRYAALGDQGYEIAVYGDSSDIAANIVYYADSLIATLRFSATGTANIHRPRHDKARVGVPDDVRWRDALGRNPRRFKSTTSRPPFPLWNDPG